MGAFFVYRKVVEDALNGIYIWIRLADQIVEIVGLISVFIAVLTYRNSKNHQRIEQRIAKLTRSINVVKSFELNVMPKIRQSRQDVKYKKGINKDKENVLERIGMPNVSLSYLDNKFNNIIQNVNRINNVVNTINRLEQWSLYVDEDMVYYKLVYRETHYEYLSFIQEYKDVLDIETSRNTPYQACHDVYRKMKKASDYNA